MLKVGIGRITKGAFSRVTPQQQTLRPGQIIQGKIVKLYPNNNAEILLGSQKMIAQVKTPLTIGEKYHFQVQATDDILHLKVLGEQLKREEKVNIKHLLQQLGLKTTKANVAMTESLINDKISFDKNQLTQAFDLLTGSKDKMLTKVVLKEMIAAKLPITDSVFQALFTHHTSGITERMKSLLAPLERSRTNVKLMGRLSQMVDRPLDSKSTIIKQILTENKHHNQQLFNLLKATGLVNMSIDFSTWQSQWEAFEERNNITPTNIQNQLLNTALPFEMDSERVVSILEQTISNKMVLQRHSTEMLQLWENKLAKTSADPVLTEQEFTVLKQQISQKITPLLSSELSAATISKYNSVHAQQILSILHTLTDKQGFADTEELLTKIKLDKLFLQAAPKEQFLAQLNQLLRFTGLAYENLLLHTDVEQQSATIKGMLLQILQKNDGTTNEPGQQLLHFINGMQINSVNEANHFIQVNLQIPGERMALNSDIELEFAGNKTRNGEIDPDYCRIVFYLDLTYLKQTVIDMNVHKRVVTVTIYNDVMEVNDQYASLQPVLKKGLADLDYHLSGIVCKPLAQNTETKISSSIKAIKSTYQGVDYRI